MPKVANHHRDVTIKGTIKKKTGLYLKALEITSSVWSVKKRRLRASLAESFKKIQKPVSCNALFFFCNIHS